MDIVSLLPTILSTVQSPGSFWGSGSVELPVVHLEIEGFGLLGLPISSAQARSLLALSTPAPYGKGPDTLVDPSVRRCGQVPAAAIADDDPRWRKVLGGVVNAAGAALGVGGTAKAELYKLLVYEPGDFFLPHRDTEKVPGMFATLVVVLPSEHVGGELRIRHDGEEAVCDLASDDLGVAGWAAFYTDCQHELLPVRAGHRVALIYNLLWPGEKVPRAPDHRPEIARLVAALRAWDADEETPPKVVLPLAHQYTLAELSFARLKNEDAAAADAFEAAAAATGATLRLAMISIEESGSASAVWTGRRDRWSRETEEEWEVEEVFERTQTLEAWRRPDDVADDMGRIAWEDEEVAPPGSLLEETPDEEHFQEASGNEGGSFERTYRRAALVLWPPSRELEVIGQGGPEAQVAALERLGRQGGKAGRMASLIVQGWERPRPGWAGDGKLRGRLLTALLGHAEPLEVFLREVVGSGGFAGEEGPAVVAALACFEAGRVGELLATIVRNSVGHRLEAVAKLLRLAAMERGGRWVGAALEVAVAGLASSVRSHDKSRQVAGLVDLVEAAGLVGDAGIAFGVPATVLADPSRWTLDEVVVPAVLQLPATGNAAFLAAAAPLRKAAIEHLELRLALPQTPPSDFRRASDGIRCNCKHCQDLKAFLESPALKTWSLQALKETRHHVEHEIGRASPDLKHETVRRGSPHTLFCTKNQASWEARMRRRPVDLEMLGRLRG